MQPDHLIPENQQGAESNTISAVQCNSLDEAEKLYQLAKQRLLNPNTWHSVAGTGTAVFTLFDKDAKEVERELQVGDYFRIDIPGPGTVAGKGYDWVKVEDKKEEQSGEESFVLVRVRPCDNPTITATDVAHFFAADATSNFMVVRKGLKVEAHVHGRNEKPNVKDTGNLVDKARNALIGSGAVAGFSKLQWKALVDGLIKE